MNKQRRNRRSDYYLDVADFVLTDHRFKVPSPIRSPAQTYLNELKCLEQFGYRYSFILAFSQTRQKQHRFPHPIICLSSLIQKELSYHHIFNKAEIPKQSFMISHYRSLKTYFTLILQEQECENSSIQSQSQFDEQSDQNLQSISEELSQKQEDLVDDEQDLPIPDLPPSKLNLKYFRQSLAQLRQKKTCQAELRDFIQEYIVLQENEPTTVQNETIDNLITMAQRNLRQLGPISWLQRRTKVLKFKAKKSRRVWNKKINYDCRKKVADSRLRVKGKFVTKEQACNILGVEQANQDELKELLGAKFHKSF